MKAGDVIFKFVVDTSDLKKVTSKLGSTLSSLAKTGGKALMGLGISAGTALTTIASKAVMMRGEVEQQIGGTEAVFKEFAKTVQSDAEKAFDKMGVSANDYMQYINKMGSLMQGSGIETKRAMELSSQAMQRASDVASIMGISVEDAMTAISGASKGNFTMMDNLGVAMNATSLSAYALEKGLKKTYTQMSQGEKVELAMQMFLEKSAYASGNYAKENKTLVGSLTTLKASIQNLVAGTGSVDQVITSLKNFGTILTENLVKLLHQIVQGITGLINGIIPMIPDIISALLPALIEGTVQLMIGIIDALPSIVQTLADMLPTLIPQIVEAIMLLIPALIQNAPKFIASGIYLIARLGEGIWNGIKSLWNKVKTWVSNLAKKMVENSPFLQAGVNLIKGLWKGISDSFTWIKNKIKGWVGNVMKFIKKLFGIGSPSKEFAIIGKFNVMGLEEGMKKESLKLQDTFDSMFDLSPNLYGSSSLNLSPVVNVTNNIDVKQDSLGQFVSQVKTFSGGAKNDYSYGMGA